MLSRANSYLIKLLSTPMNGCPLCACSNRAMGSTLSKVASLHPYQRHSSGHCPRPHSTLQRSSGSVNHSSSGHSAGVLTFGALMCGSVGGSMGQSIGRPSSSSGQKARELRVRDWGSSPILSRHVLDCNRVELVLERAQRKLLPLAHHKLGAKAKAAGRSTA